MGPMCPKSVMEEEVTPETALQQVPGPNILFNKCVQHWSRQVPAVCQAEDLKTSTIKPVPIRWSCSRGQCQTHNSNTCQVMERKLKVVGKYSKVRPRDTAEDATLNNSKSFASWAWARRDIVGDKQCGQVLKGPEESSSCPGVFSL